MKTFVLSFMAVFALTVMCSGFNPAKQNTNPASHHMYLQDPIIGDCGDVMGCDDGPADPCDNDASCDGDDPDDTDSGCDGSPDNCMNRVLPPHPGIQTVIQSLLSS